MSAFTRKNLGGEFSTHIELEEGEIEILVEYDFYPGEKATHWQPSEEPELYINCVSRRDTGEAVALDVKQAELVERAARDHVNEA